MANRTVLPEVQKLWDYGHFNNPAFPGTLNVQERDLKRLARKDRPFREAVQSFQDFQALDIEPETMKFHGRSVRVDGELGPATQKVLFAPRCGCPDYKRAQSPATGTGNWKSCHGVGNFHAAKVYWDMSNIPNFLEPLFDQVWERVKRSYAELGLKWIRTETPNEANTIASFVRRSDGWIGLAILGYNQSCSDQIWCRYLATYRGGNSDAQIVTQWTSLIKHELGHNCGLEHSRGGVMNPSIMRGLPVSWDGDPSKPQLDRWFGGEPINPEPGPEPDPPNGPRLGMDGRLVVSVPENVTPGEYEFIPVPRPEV